MAIIIVFLGFFFIREKVEKRNFFVTLCLGIFSPHLHFSSVFYFISQKKSLIYVPFARKNSLFFVIQQKK